MPLRSVITMAWHVTCPKCSFETTVDSLEEVFEVEKEHQQCERLSHVVEFERVSDESD